MPLLLESPWPGRPPDGKQLRGVMQLCYNYQGMGEKRLKEGAPKNGIKALQDK